MPQGVGPEGIYDVIKHLLVGHDGNACPAGDRPIGVTASSFRDTAVTLVVALTQAAFW